MTRSPLSVYSAAVTAWWCCPECETVRLCCPGCAERLLIQRPPDHPPGLPLHRQAICPDPACGAGVAITVCGYRPNPTGDAPAIRSPLSDPLPVAERPRPAPRPAPRAQQPASEQEQEARFASFFNGETQPTPTPPERTQAQAHAARYLRRRGYINTALELQERPRAPRPRQPRTPTPAAAAAAARLADFRRTFPVDRTPRPKKPPAPPKPAPCPAGEPRYRLAAWDEWGWLPPGVAPSAIAAAYRRRFGVEPRRDATYRTFRAYSLRELGMALGELGLAPAAEPRQGVGQ